MSAINSRLEIGCLASTLMAFSSGRCNSVLALNIVSCKLMEGLLFGDFSLYHVLSRIWRVKICIVWWGLNITYHFGNHSALIEFEKLYFTDEKSVWIGAFWPTLNWNVSQQT